MRCLYCGKQLALLRRLTGGGEFCSEAHKQSYHEEYNRLALSRLLEAQSKPEAYQRVEPEPDTPGKGEMSVVHAKKNTSRDSEEWTTVSRTNQKRLGAPTARTALPAAPPDKPAPGKASFLVDKPRLRVPKEVEPPQLIVSPVLGCSELSQPRLFCKLAELQNAQTPAKAGLVELAPTPAYVKPVLRRTQAEPLFIEPRGTTRIDSALSTAVMPALALADLIPMESSPAGTAKPEPELQPAYNFEFECVFNNVAGLPPDCRLLTRPVQKRDRKEAATSAGEAEERENVGCETVVPEPEHRLFDLFPLNIRPFPVTSRERTLQFEQIPMQAFQPALPAGSPLPLRPRVAAADPSRAVPKVLAKVSGPSRGAVKLSLATSERDAPNTPPQPGVAQNRPAEQTPSAAEVELPEFLRGLEGTASPKSVWGNVHKYLKNIVGCLLFAALGGGYFWHLSATKVPDSSIVGAEFSGEADRVKPERQIFVYPASMLLQDYRVDFEAPLTTKGTGWVFRVADPRNYYGMRLESERDGAGLRWKIEKYVEVEGEHILSETIHLAHTAETGYCRITLEVQGSQFRTYVQGRLIDRWTDTRFSRGGFGYYGGASEPFPIRSVRVAALDSAIPRVDHRE
ncbi:MAG: hypothetical protein M3Y27_15040 [Acidobacteriota bacterium]|nr:hypothetical protein [Acidobacteriota bacterium]